jgi:type IV pilus assembly protein PilY1
LGSVAATYTTQFTNFLRGDHTEEGVGKPFRVRMNSSGKAFELGDFVNSNPVLVKDSFNGLYGNLGLGGTTGYSTFLAAKAARTSVLFAGSNDGMLHAFKDTKSATAASALTDGREVFAYVPRAVYSNLHKLTDKAYGSATLAHQFYVDGPLREADAFVNAPGASTPTWRNYLVGSLGAGGRAVFALDVTDSANMGPSTVRWEISSDQEADLGYVMAPIKVGVLKNGRWVALFGNGFSSSNGYATLFVVDIENAASSDAAVRAAAVKKLNVDTSGSNGLGGVTIIHDASGQIDTVYAGDLKGRLWKLNYNASAGSYFSIDGGAALFTATDGGGTAQPITSSPAVYNHSLGGKMLVFGTGKLFSTSDAVDTSTQSVYGVWDKPSDALSHPLSRTNLQARTLTSFTGTGTASSTTFYSLAGTAVVWASQRGWYFDLSTALVGGRVIYPAQVAGFDTALVSSVAPVQGTPAACDASSGIGVNLLLPVESGSNPTNHNFNTDGDAGGLANSSDAYAVGYSARADGIDAIVRQIGTSGSDGLRDVGGGGGEGDCTGAICSKAGNTCVPSPLCPEPNTCLASIQSAMSGFTVCISTGTPPTPPIAGNRQYDRVWRRIINPPIR